MPFKIAGGHGWGNIQEFVNNMDGPAFLERELMGLGEVIRVSVNDMDGVPYPYFPFSP